MVRDKDGWRDVAIVKDGEVTHIPDDGVVKEAKQLIISPKGGRKYEYTFDGDWSGRDILVIQRGLRRAYFGHQRSIRLSKLAKQEVTNG